MVKNHEKMQFIGFFGIYKESYMVMLSWWKIFSMIALTFILPLFNIILPLMLVSQFTFRDILNLSKTQFGTPQQKELIEKFSIDLYVFISFKVLHFGWALLSSTFSTSAVVYSMASIYAGREVTFKNVARTAPKVCRRLIITLLCTFAAFFIYNFMVGFIALGFIIVWPPIIEEKNYGILVLLIIGVFYLAGLLYLATVWQLANVVTVLEDSCGFKAMMKSNELIKGKKGLSMIITFMLAVSFFSVQFLLSMVLVKDWKLFQLALVWRIPCGVVFVLVLSHLFLLMFVVQTVLYFVCKSYHNEIIDMSALPEKLEVDHGVYEALKAEDVQKDSHV